MIQSSNPATGETLSNYDTLDSGQVDQRLGRAEDAFLNWRRTSFSERAEKMKKAAEILRERAREFGELMTREMGKPISGGVSEAEKCAWVCDYYAEKAEEFLASESIESAGSNSFVAYRPLGPVLAVMPWNFPFWQVFRFAAPGLMAGNVGLLKHASNVPGCALAIEDVFHQAGFPEDAFQTLLIDTDLVSDVIADRRVAAVTLTGSTRAGRAVAASAGEALKKSVLELGGSDPYVVLEDADVETAARTCVTSRLINSGQSCIAAKRFIVVDEVYDAFVEPMLDAMKSAQVGDPMDEETDIGPMAREDLRDELHDQVRRSIEGGARCVLGGEVPDRAGAWYPPTVLLDVKPGMAAYEEELFGPVAAVIRARDEDDAIRIANDSQFGLGAAVFTRDEERGRRIAEERLEAGCCFVNDFVRSDPRLPFGGIKTSGYGRELSRHGIREFVNTKTVWIK